MMLTIYVVDRDGGGERILTQNVSVANMVVNIPTPEPWSGPRFDEAEISINGTIVISTEDMLRTMRLLIDLDGTTITINQCKIRSIEVTADDNVLLTKITWCFSHRFLNNYRLPEITVPMETKKISWQKCGF